MRERIQETATTVELYKALGMNPDSESEGCRNSWSLQDVVRRLLDHWITARRLWNDTRLHLSSSCPVSLALWLELGSRSQHGGFGTTPIFTRALLVQSARPCGLNTALNHSTEALEGHPPSLVLLLSSQRGLVA